MTSRILGVAIRIIAPKELQPEQQVIELAEQFAQASQAEILITDDVAAVAGADVVYTEVWVSMGEEAKFKERIDLLMPYQVNAELMKTNNEQAIFLHCLPAFHDTQTKYGAKIAADFGLKEMEVTNDVFHSKQARQFDQAENRLHSIKAIMAVTLGDLFIPKV